MPPIKIIIAQLNFTVGSIADNTQQIIDAIRAAIESHQADVIIFPELSICGYPPEDILLRPGLYPAVNNALKNIKAATKNIYAIVGHPVLNDGKRYNACSVMHNGELLQCYYKQRLPNYGVFDEQRYFTAGDKVGLFDLNGIIAAVSICEDIWFKEPIIEAAEKGTEIMFNINASPYDKGKSAKREEMIAERARNANMPIVYANLVGGQDELVFDGNSIVVDNRGQCLFRAPMFEAGLFALKLDARPSTIPYLPQEESIYKALVLGVKDYVSKNNFNGVIIGLSGGIDSALTLAIAVDALGADNVEVLIMPSRYTAQISIDDARSQAKTLGVTHQEISIEPPFTAFLTVLQSRFEGLEKDITEENIQARCRGVLLMAAANKSNKIVLTTSNKSETAVGYTTLYGDMAGGFAPLADIWKTMVYRLANWRNQLNPVIPKRVIQRAPTAELKPEQKDQDTLPDYACLDRILEYYIEQDLTVDEIIAHGFDAVMVQEIIKRVDQNEYKRRQAAPGVRITKRAFGKDRRYPISSGYVPG